MVGLCIVYLSWFVFDFNCDLCKTLTWKETLYFSDPWVCCQWDLNWVLYLHLCVFTSFPISLPTQGWHIHSYSNPYLFSASSLGSSPNSFFLNLSSLAFSSWQMNNQKLKNKTRKDFPGGPMVKTPSFQCRGCIACSIPGSRNQDLTCHVAWLKNRRKKKLRVNLYVI